MSTRRDAREWAVQLLFQIDLNPVEDVSKTFAHFWEGKTSDKSSRKYTESLVTGVRESITGLDEQIGGFAKNWDVKRMGVIDRNILRMAIYEMKSIDDVPCVVSINEAVDLAKYFSSIESGKFVNGILDRARKDYESAL